MIKKHGEKVSQEELRKWVMEAGTSWYHHCLPVGCFINDTGKDIIVLEAGPDMFYCDWSRAMHEELEEHAYRFNHPRKTKSAAVKHEVLDLIRDYASSGDKWHFHIAMPHCLMAMSDGFTLILENDTKKKKQEWLFDAKPVALVRVIDDYYPGRKKSNLKNTPVCFIRGKKIMNSFGSTLTATSLDQGAS